MNPTPSQDAASRGAPFTLAAPTTARNAFRLLRAMQLRKAVLLEGSPGVGKTSLVAALARALGQTLVSHTTAPPARTPKSWLSPSHPARASDAQQAMFVRFASLVVLRRVHRRCASTSRNRPI
jgi:hypothetical protein